MSNPKRIEPLTDDELSFVEKRYRIAAQSFYFGMRILLAVIILMPIVVVMIYRNFESKDDLSNGQIWLYSQIITLIIYTIGFVAGYMQLLYAYTRDLKHKQKVIETVLIQEKKYMPQNNTYHFYINSEPTYSIEVDASVYEAFGINDEINIEYVRYTEIYLGYF